MNEFPVLFLLALFHTIFSLTIILNKKNRAMYDSIASVWLIFICFATMRRSLQIYYGDEFDTWFLKIIFYPLAYGPCLYLYTRMQTDNEKNWTNKNLLHFIPFLFFTLISFLPGISIANLKTKSQEIKYSLLFFQSFAFASWISILVYSYCAYKMIKAHSMNLLEKFSYLSIDNSLSWVNRFSLFFVVVMSIQNIISLYTNFSSQNIISGKVNGWLLFGFLYVLSFFFIRQDSVFAKVDTSEEQGRKVKYGKSGLTETKMKEIATALIQYMESEKPYLKPDLTISDIANALDININYLSQIINSNFKKNFFMFINDYRVADVIRKMEDSSYDEFPVLRIAFESGFNSKSSFNAIFRKSTGMTPVEYRTKKK